jgi:hypothetical protein
LGESAQGKEIASAEFLRSDFSILEAGEKGRENDF